MQRLSRQIREAIQEQRYPRFVRQYVVRQFPTGDVPDWVVEGCKLAGISLSADADLLEPSGIAAAPAMAAAAAAAAAAAGSVDGTPGVG